MLVETTKQILDEYWELLMNARSKSDGPDGIKLWNSLSEKIKNQDHCQIVCKILLDLKSDCTKELDNIV